MLGSVLEYALTLHMREQIRHDAFASAEISAEADAGIEIAIAFADLVGFTKLGERLDPAEIGDMTDELSEHGGGRGRRPGAAREADRRRGDAHLAGPEVPAGRGAGARRGVGEGGEDFPLLRGGVAQGRVVARGGDYYGRPVNLASRITAMARPGSVVCDEAMHDALEDGYEWSFAGSRRLKGIDGEREALPRPA